MPVPFKILMQNNRPLFAIARFAYFSFEHNKERRKFSLSAFLSVSALQGYELRFVPDVRY